MFCSGADVNMSSKRAGTRSRIYSIPETIYLYYNSLISMLCRKKENTRQGTVVFCWPMLRFGLIVLLISCPGAFAAEAARQPRAAAQKKQRASAPVKVPAVLPAKIDEALQREHNARLAEISAIEKTSGTVNASALKPLLSDKSPLVRGEAAVAIGKIKAPAAFEELSAGVNSEDEHLRWGAVQGLAELGDKRAVPLLIQALGHPDHNTRWKAAQGLGQLKDARGIDALTGAARADKNKNVRLASIEALMNIGGGKVASILGDLKYDPDPEIKAWAAAAAEKVDISMR